MLDASTALKTEGRVVNVKKIVTDGSLAEGTDVVRGYVNLQTDTSITQLNAKSVVMVQHRRGGKAIDKDAGIHHQQLMRRTMLALEHDPTETHLRIDLQDASWQLSYRDRALRADPKLAYSWLR